MKQYGKIPLMMLLFGLLLQFSLVAKCNFVTTAQLDTAHDIAMADILAGVLTSPVAMQHHFTDWVDDPLNPNKLPVVGPTGQHIGDSHGKFSVDPTFENFLDATAATSEGTLLILGTVQTARAMGLPGTYGNDPILNKTTYDTDYSLDYELTNSNTSTLNDTPDSSPSTHRELVNDFKTNPQNWEQTGAQVGETPSGQHKGVSTLSHSGEAM